MGSNVQSRMNQLMPEGSNCWLVPQTLHVQESFVSVMYSILTTVGRQTTYLLLCPFVGCRNEQWHRTPLNRKCPPLKLRPLVEEPHPRALKWTLLWLGGLRSVTYSSRLAYTAAVTLPLLDWTKKSGRHCLRHFLTQTLMYSLMCSVM